MARFSVGTTPVLIANENKFRNSWNVEMLPTSVESGNTGRVHVGRGHIPTTVVGDPSQGTVLQQSDLVGDEARYAGDTSVFKGKIWAVGSAASQVVDFIETQDMPAPEAKTT